MAGINAVASSKTHAASGVDVAVAGFIAGEQVALTTDPTGTDYQWAIALPAGSNSARVGFAGDTEAAASFTPDVTGLYAVMVTVDGTTYYLRIAVVALAISSSLEGLRFSPVANDQIPTPAVGGILFWSSDEDALAVKGVSGLVRTVDTTAT